MNTKHRILFILIGGGNVYTGEGSAGIGSTQYLKLNAKDMMVILYLYQSTFYIFFEARPN